MGQRIDNFELAVRQIILVEVIGIVHWN